MQLVLRVAAAATHDSRGVDMLGLTRTRRRGKCGGKRSEGAMPSSSPIAPCRLSATARRFPSKLDIGALPGAVRLSCTTDATGHALETNGPALLPGGWSALGATPAVETDEFVVTNAIDSQVLCYRLKKP